LAGFFTKIDRISIWGEFNIQKTVQLVKRRILALGSDLGSAPGSNPKSSFYRSRLKNTLAQGTHWRQESNTGVIMRWWREKDSLGYHE
jgi:hypothetical protein